MGLFFIPGVGEILITAALIILAAWLIYKLCHITAAAMLQAKIISAANANVRATVQKKSKIRYWSATLKPGYVNIGRPLTFSQAVKEVATGRNVFAVTRYEAESIARAAGGSTGANNRHLYPEIDRGRSNTIGYYWHYHTYNRNGGYVFYLF